jgi:hypothetical protein
MGVITQMVRDHFSQRYATAQDALTALQTLALQAGRPPKTQPGPPLAPNLGFSTPTWVSPPQPAGQTAITLRLAEVPSAVPPHQRRKNAGGSGD